MPYCLRRMLHTKVPDRLALNLVLAWAGARCILGQSVRECRSSAACSICHTQLWSALNVTPRQHVIAGLYQTLAQRRRRRNQLLREQLQPQGRFDTYNHGVGSVYATGNGCFTMIGWIDSMLDGTDDRWDGVSDVVRCMNKPTALSRGISAVWSSSSSSDVDNT